MNESDLGFVKLTTQRCAIHGVNLANKIRTYTIMIVSTLLGD